VRFHTAGDAKSAQSALYDCLVPYEDTSMETTLKTSLDMPQLLLLDYIARGTAVERRSLAGELFLS